MTDPKLDPRNAYTREVRREPVVVREDETGTGLLTGILIATVVALGIGTYFMLSQKPVAQTPSKTTVIEKTKEVPGKTTVIEKTKEVPVVQPNAPDVHIEVPQPTTPNVNIQVPPQKAPDVNIQVPQAPAPQASTPAAPAAPQAAPAAPESSSAPAAPTAPTKP